MAVRFITSDPAKLLASFKKAIDDGKVVTWAYDKDGDFTHTAPQWKFSAWLHPKVIPGEKLIFTTVPPQNSKVSTEVYAVYHGRFIESMLAHCDSLFTSAVATAFPADGDIIS